MFKRESRGGGKARISSPLCFIVYNDVVVIGMDDFSKTADTFVRALELYDFVYRIGAGIIIPTVPH